MLKEKPAPENAAYAGTSRMSEGNRARGFVSVFLNTGTDITYKFCDPAGWLGLIHLLNRVPVLRIEARTAAGSMARVKVSILSRFLRDGQLYARSDAAALVDAVHVL